MVYMVYSIGIEGEDTYILSKKVERWREGERGMEM